MFPVVFILMIGFFTFVLVFPIYVLWLIYRKASDAISENKNENVAAESRRIKVLAGVLGAVILLCSFLYVYPNSEFNKLGDAFLVAFIFSISFLIFYPVVRLFFKLILRLVAGGSETNREAMQGKQWIRILTCVIYLVFPVSLFYLGSSDLPLLGWSKPWGQIPTESMTYCVSGNGKLFLTEWNTTSWLLFLIEWSLVIGLSCWVARNKSIKDLMITFIVFSTYLILVVTSVLNSLGYHDAFWGFGN